MRERIIDFWQRAPALYYSLYILLAILFTLSTPWAFLFVLLLLWDRRLHQTLIAITLFLATLYYLQHNLYFPPAHSPGNFLFHITDVTAPKKSFQKGALYKGTVREIIDGEGNKERCCLPTHLYVNQPLALDYAYWVKGTLHAKNKGSYFIRSVESPTMNKKRVTLCKIRERSKRGLQHYIHTHYKGALTAPFLIALTTGKNEDPLLRGHLTQIGCAHLLAISGFHFGLIAAFCHFLLKPFFHYKIHTFLVIGLLLTYLLFIGKSPSIYRAFIFATCFLMAPIVERRSSAINTLGVALGLCLILDPMMAIDVGFQLSFLATGAIIVLYPKVRDYLLYESDGRMMGFLMKGVALNVAIHFALIPLTLLYFHSINLHSMLYNLFFPSLTALSLLLFLSASCLHPLLPPVAKLLHFSNGLITESFLWVAENRPLYEKTLFWDGTPAWLITLLFIVLYGLALGKKC